MWGMVIKAVTSGETKMKCLYLTFIYNRKEIGHHSRRVFTTFWYVIIMGLFSLILNVNLYVQSKYCHTTCCFLSAGGQCVIQHPRGWTRRKKKKKDLLWVCGKILLSPICYSSFCYPTAKLHSFTLHQQHCKFHFCLLMEQCSINQMFKNWG